MNKHLYRIIFNKARGLLMVVAEITRSGREGSRRMRSGQTTDRRSCRLSPLSCALLALFGTVTLINSAHAGIVADGQAPNSQQPNVMTSANGTPQVNIQTPSEAGVSRNSYSQFDVERKGAILNNSHNNVATELGGMVQGNPWLAKGEARIILNEVNSRDPSQLNGHIEVAGRNAQVVIANPSGISCNGCGFINANRATLTTGQAQINNGQLTGFDVDRGEIVIQGAGMNSLKQDYTDIIARSVKINAEIDARDLKITTGRNQIDAEHQRIDKKSSDGSTRPQLALDVSQLGGMYANKIRLMGTEDGVGVHNAGSIGAQAGSLVVTADGLIENSGKMSSKENTALTSRTAINNSGEMLAEGNASLSTGGDLHNSGSIISRNHLQTQSVSLNSEQGSVLAAGVQQDGKLGGSGNLTLDTSGQLRAQGQNLASGNLIARGQGVDISHSQTGAQNIELDAGQADLLTGNGSQISAQQQLTASSSKTINNDGGKLAADKLTIRANDLSNQQGSISQLGGDSLQFSQPGMLNNREGSITSNGRNLILSAAQINNQGGQIVHSADGELTLTSGNHLSNRDGQILQMGNGGMNLNVFNAVDNQNGQIAGNGNISLNAASLNNEKGNIAALQNGSLGLQVAGELNNQQGQLGV
ncbi:MAG: filamentous hemagglutinin N-terminal domain-containing protein [Ewingella sp.]